MFGGGNVDDCLIMIADMRSFFASVEQQLNPSLKNKPVIVCGDPERRAAIVLAASPEAKSFGIKTAMPLWEAKALCPEVVIAQPHMQKYIDYSLKITEIAYKYTPLYENYSIDEIFLDLKGTQYLYGSPRQIAFTFQQEVRQKTGIATCIGISYNKFMAKMALDVEAKKNANGIAYWSREEGLEKLHSLPIQAMFMVGSRMARNFRNMGISTIGQLAHFPKEMLKKRWGIMGEVYHELSWGIDHSPVDNETFQNDVKGIGNGATLPRDYCLIEEIADVLFEITEDVCRRVRSKGLCGKTVSLSVRSHDLTSGFHRSKSMEDYSNITEEVFKEVRLLFEKHWDHRPIRAVAINLSGLIEDSFLQLTCFDNRLQKRKLGYVIDSIRDKFGNAALLRAISIKEQGIGLDRAHKIGGHKA